jgi:enoyl-CoA hydratase/carnithine racemase
MSDDAWFGQHRIFEQAAAAMGDCPVPMIAAVNGVAFGGGCELALTCDLILASSGARFAQPESKLGIMPGLGGTQRLPRRIGLARASEMLLTGDAIDAGCALSWGLVNRVCAPEKLLLEALALAERIASNGPRAVQQIKQVIGSGWGLPIHQALELEIDAYNTVVGTQDRREGIRAFHEKRKPVFDGT